MDVGIFKALFFRPDVVSKLEVYEMADKLEGLYRLDTTAAPQKNFGQSSCGAIMEVAEFPRLIGRDELTREREFLMEQGDEIGLGVTGRIENAVYGFESRYGNFRGIFTNFDSGKKFIVMFNGNKFVDRAEDGFAFGGDETFADAERIDFCALSEERGDGEFVQGVGSGDFTIG